MLYDKVKISVNNQYIIWEKEMRMELVKGSIFLAIKKGSQKCTFV